MSPVIYWFVQILSVCYVVYAGRRLLTHNFNEPGHLEKVAIVAMVCAVLAAGGFWAVTLESFVNSEFNPYAREGGLRSYTQLQSLDLMVFLVSRGLSVLGLPLGLGVVGGAFWKAYRRQQGKTGAYQDKGASKSPADIAAHLAKIHRAQDLRALGQLVQQNAQYMNRPLEESVIIRLRSASNDVLKEARRHGLLDGAPDLQARLDTHHKTAQQTAWEDFIERRNGPVGRGIVAILKEALVHQDDRVMIEWTGLEGAHPSVRQLRSRIQASLQRHLDKHHLRLLGHDVKDPPPFCLQMDVQEHDVEILFKSRKDEPERCYPIVKLRARLMRRQFLEVEGHASNERGVEKIDRAANTQDQARLIKLGTEEILLPLLRAIGWTAQATSDQNKKEAASTLSHRANVQR